MTTVRKYELYTRNHKFVVDSVDQLIEEVVVLREKLEKLETFIIDIYPSYAEELDDCNSED